MQAFALNFLPWWLRGLGPVSRAVAQWGIGRFASKYQKESSSTSREAVRRGIACVHSGSVHVIVVWHTAYTRAACVHSFVYGV